MLKRITLALSYSADASLFEMEDVDGILETLISRANKNVNQQNGANENSSEDGGSKHDKHVDGDKGEKCDEKQQLSTLNVSVCMPIHQKINIK